MLLDFNRTASGQLLTVYRRYWNGPPLQSIHNSALLPQELVVHWKTSGTLHTVPAASAVSHVPPLGINDLFMRHHTLKSAGVRPGDCEGHTTGLFHPIHRPVMWLLMHHVMSRMAGFPSCSTHVVCCIANSTSSSSCGNCSDGTTYKRHPIIVTVAHKDLWEGHKLFLPKQLLRITSETMFLERNVYFHQCMCAGYKFT